MFSFIIFSLCVQHCISFGIWPTVNRFPMFQYLENFYENNQYLPSKSILLNPKINSVNMTDHDKFQSQWYTIGRKDDFPFRVPKKITIYGKNYVVWKKNALDYVCLSDTCPHGGESLSKGRISNTCITCSQHQSAFNENGELVYGETTFLEGSQLYEVPHFQVAEKNDMLYLNTYENIGNSTITQRDFSYTNTNYSSIYIEDNINIPSAILLENSLDVVHILFAKLFTNKESIEPDCVGEIRVHNPLHYSIKYTYKSNVRSILKKLFDSDSLVIYSEVISPFTTISRVIIKDKEFVFETNILPVGINNSRVFVRCYRNFNLSYGGDRFINEVIQKVLNVYSQLSLRRV